jgi:Cys-tRNA(Pro)/Cys-tRNA(Cys) deacylase
MKTNAARVLERLGIPHEIRSYPVDPDDLSALRVAQKVGLPAAQLFKTLVVKGDRTGVHLAVVPGDTELDLKALARVTEIGRRAGTAQEVQPLTGYLRGGVTALAAKKGTRWCSIAARSGGR